MSAPAASDAPATVTESNGLTHDDNKVDGQRPNEKTSNGHHNGNEKLGNDVKTDVFEADTQELLSTGELDPVYAAKAKILNDAIQEIGFGRYQAWLFVMVGFGFSADNWLPILTSLIFTPVVNEFNPQRGPYLQLLQNLGLLVGAFGWGLGSDVIGRRWAFNITFGITGIFALLAGSSPTFAGVCAYAFLWSIGVGGNLPVDSAIFLEYLPASHQWLLTVLSIWWAFAQVFITLIAWGLLGRYTCSQAVADAGQCFRDNNMGWRYLAFVSGGIYILIFLARFFFPLRESAKFLMGKGKDEQAVETIHFVARFNRKPTNLTIEHLRAVDQAHGVTNTKAISAADAVKANLSRFDLSHVRNLFQTRKQTFGTIIVFWIWALIGLAFPLYNSFIPYYLATRGAAAGDGSTYITYRNSLIIAVLGIPGVLLGGWLVELPYLGRKGALAMSTALTGTFILASTTARTSDALLGFNCAYNFFSNIMFAVLYAVTPEIFPTKDRGTGNGLAASCNRIFGVFAPIIAIFADLTTSAPIWVAGVLFLVAGALSVLLPYEPRGKAAM